VWELMCNPAAMRKCRLTGLAFPAMTVTCSGNRYWTASSFTSERLSPKGLAVSCKCRESDDRAGHEHDGLFHFRPYSPSAFFDIHFDVAGRRNAHLRRDHCPIAVDEERCWHCVEATICLRNTVAIYKDRIGHLFLGKTNLAMAALSLAQPALSSSFRSSASAEDAENLKSLARVLICADR